MITKPSLIALSVLIATSAFAQKPWNGKRAAIVLTYDDGIDGHLDKVVPVLDTFGLKGTFYVIAEIR